MTAQFHPFNPRRLRLGFLVGAVACAALTAVAVDAARTEGASALVVARAGLSLGLLMAFGYVFVRLRPRRDWGVHLSSEGASIARPFSDEALEVPWSAVERVFRHGRRRESLVLSGRRGQITVARHLFPSDEAFDRLVEAMERHAPQPRYDA